MTPFTPSHELTHSQAHAISRNHALIRVYELTHSHADSHQHAHSTRHGHSATISPSRSVLAWPAWLRVAAVLPVILLLWLAVWWTNAGVLPW